MMEVVSVSMLLGGLLTVLIGAVMYNNWWAFGIGGLVFLLGIGGLGL